MSECNMAASLGSLRTVDSSSFATHSSSVSQSFSVCGRQPIDVCCDELIDELSCGSGIPSEYAGFCTGTNADWFSIGESTRFRLLLGKTVIVLGET